MAAKYTFTVSTKDSSKSMSRSTYMRLAPPSTTIFRLTKDELQQRVDVGFQFIEMNGEWRNTSYYLLFVKRLNTMKLKGFHMPWYTIRGEGFCLEDPQLFLEK